MSASAMPEFAPTIGGGRVRLDCVKLVGAPRKVPKGDGFDGWALPFTNLGPGNSIGPFPTKEAAEAFAAVKFPTLNLSGPVGAVA